MTDNRRSLSSLHDIRTSTGALPQTLANSVCFADYYLIGTGPRRLYTRSIVFGSLSGLRSEIPPLITTIYVLIRIIIRQIICLVSGPGSGFGSTLHQNFRLLQSLFAQEVLKGGVRWERQRALRATDPSCHGDTALPRTIYLSLQCY